MANTVQMRFQANLRGGAMQPTFGADASLTLTGTGFDCRALSVQSDADGWTQYTMPTEMADIRILAIHNLSGNTHNVRVALTAAATYVTNEIPPGSFCVLCKPTAASIYISHKGGTGLVRSVEILAIPS
jgi:hypothetical protein